MAGASLDSYQAQLPDEPVLFDSSRLARMCAELFPEYDRSSPIANISPSVKTVWVAIEGFRNPTSAFDRKCFTDILDTINKKVLPYLQEFEMSCRKQREKEAREEVEEKELDELIKLEAKSVAFEIDVAEDWQKLADLEIKYGSRRQIKTTPEIIAEEFTYSVDGKSEKISRDDFLEEVVSLRKSFESIVKLLTVQLSHSTSTLVDVRQDELRRAEPIHRPPSEGSGGGGGGVARQLTGFAGYRQEHGRRAKGEGRVELDTRVDYTRVTLSGSSARLPPADLEQSVFVKSAEDLLRGSRGGR